MKISRHRCDTENNEAFKANRITNNSRDPVHIHVTTSTIQLRLKKEEKEQVI